MYKKRRETSRRSPLFGSTTPSLFGAFTTEVIEEKESGKFKKQDQNGSNKKRKGARWNGKKRYSRRSNKSHKSSNVPSISAVSYSDVDSHVKLHTSTGISGSADTNVPEDIPVSDNFEEISTHAVENDHNALVHETLNANETAVQCKAEEKVPTNDVVSWVFVESSALEQVVAIHSGMAAEWAGLVSSQAKPVEVYSQKVMSGG
ncbi:hypothetical protein TNCV_835461 [Trichonephila clavipes]|nr:hypothetical protein TNCV_835461 [Trichonephila clavipes]